MEPISHKSRFMKYRDDSTIEKSRLYAQFTLPQLMADLSVVASSNTRVTVERDWQEMGALLVNYLSAKLAGILFPSNHPFFKASLSAALIERALSNGASESELHAGLAKVEMDACQQLFKNASYNQLVFALKHLIVTGNVLLYRDSGARKSTAYGLQSYSCRRDGRGQLMDCVLREFTFLDALPPDIQMYLKSRYPERYRNRDALDCKVELYTRIYRTLSRSGKTFVIKVTQQVDEGLDVGKPGTYPEHLCPWQAPTWNLIAGEHYGRGLVEDYAGGFAKLSDASEAAALYGIEAMRVINLVAPGSGSDVDSMARAETGEWVSGTKESVMAHESGDAPKMEAMRAEIEATYGRLATAFMYSSNTRDAERVTAYEIAQDAREAEKSLGGVYSSLAESLQVPLAHVLITEVAPGVLEGIITQDVKLDIMAGIPALGRSSDVQNILTASQEASAIVPALKQLDSRIDIAKLMDVIYAGQSVDTSQIFMSKEDMAKMDRANKQQAEGQQQIAQAATLGDQTEALQTVQQGS